MSWNLRYDHIFHIVDAHSSLDALARKHPDELKQNGGDVLLTVAPHIKTIVEKSLGRRAVKVDVKCGNYVELKHGNLFPFKWALIHWIDLTFLSDCLFDRLTD